MAIIDPSVVKEALFVTAISIGTAFGLLVLLTVIIILVRLLSTRILDRIATSVADEAVKSKEKALSAAIAVTTLLANSEDTISSVDES